MKCGTLIYELSVTFVVRAIAGLSDRTIHTCVHTGIIQAYNKPAPDHININTGYVINQPSQFL